MIQKNEVLIAGRALWEFGAKMVAFPEITTDVDSAVFQGLERSSIQLLHLRQAGMHMDCEIDYFGTLTERDRHRSELEAILITAMEPVVIDYGDGYFYRAVLEKNPSVNSKNDVFTEVGYRFRVTRHTDPVILEIMDGEFNFFCQSNVPLTDCLISIPPLTTWPDLNVLLNFGTPQRQEFTLDMTPTGGIVLDGISKIFKMNGSNITNHDKFTWTTFPALKPGDNQILISTEGVLGTLTQPVQIYYTPTYL